MFGRRSANTLFWMKHSGKELKMCSFIDLMYCLSWDCYSHLLATVARHQLNKKGGHSSEENRQKLFTEACERYQLSGKILLADCDWAGTPVYR